MESLQGQLLIASQRLLDPNFARTIVLVAVHGEEGALGLIVNRDAGMSLDDIWGQISQVQCLREGTVRHGGPVAGTLMAVHDQRPLANLVVTDDLFVATELSAMELLAASNEGRALFYLGHSGWGPGQLENELAEGSWLVLPASPENIFGDIDQDASWKHCLVEAGRRQVRSIVPIRHVPENPMMN